MPDASPPAGPRGPRSGRSRFDQFVEDILAGPDELAAVIDAHGRGVSALPDAMLEAPRWRFAGMGSSRFAALDAAAALRSAGVDAVAEVASASSPSPGGDDTLFVAISNSGRTHEVLAAAKRHGGVSHVLALTASADSPLAGLADAVLPLVAARAEEGGIATLSYRSTVVALQLLAGAAVPALGAGGIAAAVPVLEAVLRDRAGWLADAADVLDTGRPVHVLGDGARIGHVEQAALMLREAPRIEALAYDTGDWLHVGLYTVFPGDAVLLFTGAAADEAAVAVVHARGARVVAVGEPVRDADLHVPIPDVARSDPAIRAIVESTVADLLAAELWRRADARVLGEAPAGA